MSMRKWDWTGLPFVSAMIPRSTDFSYPDSPQPPKPPRAPEPVQFPGLEEQLSETVLPDSSSKRHRGLFEELLLSRPEGMHADALEHPEKYDERVPPLLEDLVNRQRPPTEEERGLLDLAVHSFVAPAPKAQAKKERPRAVAREEEEFRTPEFAREPPTGESEASLDNDMKPFWWL